jgi:hypothetical protein
MTASQWLWAATAAIITTISLILLREVESTNSSPVPSIGAEVYYASIQKAPKTPDILVSIDGDSVRIQALFKADPLLRQMKLVVTDAKPDSCSATNATIHVWPSQYSFSEKRGTNPYGLTEEHPMLLDVYPMGGGDIWVTCALATRPLHDSFSTRALDFYPPAPGKLILGKPREVYTRTLPEHVSFSVTGNLDVRVSGPIGRGVIPSIWDERIVGDDAFVIRARWEDIAARATRNYLTFFAAALLGLAFAALLEAIRPLIETEGQS